MTTTTKTDVTVKVEDNAINEKAYGLDKKAVMITKYPGPDVDFNKMCKLTAVHVHVSSLARLPSSPPRPPFLCLVAPRLAPTLHPLGSHTPPV
jgi:hypothetical protein